MATDFACFRGFRRRGICHRLPLVATAGLHKRSILRRHDKDFVCAVLAGIALSEERQLHGDRVRRRVVAEYDVALLAQSPDDARRGRKRTFAGATSSKAWAQARRGRTETVAR